MAASTVVLSEQIRPWHNAGLRFLFDEDGSLAQAMAEAQTAQSAPVVPESPSSTVASMPPRQNPSVDHAPQHSQQNRSAQQPQQRASQTPQARAPHGQQEQHQNAVPPRAMPSLVIHPTNKSPEEWPQQWQGYWSKVQVPSPVVWTYWSLGDDLSGHADPKRREVLKKLISSLNLPRGTSSFWPVASSGDTPDSLTAAPEIYLAGLRRLRPRYSVVFGSKALKSFMPDSKLRPYLFTQFLGHRLIALPDVDYLVKSPNMLAPVIAYLRTAIRLSR